MTTDITELAQREKFEAWAEERCALPCGYLKNRRTNTGYFSKHDYTSLWAAWKAAGAELVEALEKAQTINAAAEKLVRCKGRYHSEQNYRALAALFGVITPDLPPLDSESRSVTVKLESRRLPSDYVDGEFGNDDLAATHNACRLECKVSVEKYLSAHGIVVKWEDE